MASTNTRAQRRTVVTLLALVMAVAIAAVVIVISLTPSSTPRREAPPEAASTSAPTALEAYPAARDAALQWADDAQLAGAAGAWTPPINTGVMTTGRTSWSFFFYSRSLGGMATVVATEQGGQIDAQFISSMAFPTETALLSDVGWVIDSNEVVRMLLENGGTAFMSGREDQVAVNLRLSTAASNGRILWIASALHGSDPSLASLVVEVDATTGEVQNVQ